MVTSFGFHQFALLFGGRSKQGLHKRTKTSRIDVLGCSISELKFQIGTEPNERHAYQPIAGQYITSGIILFLKHFLGSMNGYCNCFLFCGSDCTTYESKQKHDD